MATVDLYGGDAERIRNQYRTSLGRDASNDEVSGWLSGSYGGGGVDNWLQQISSSDEARQRTQTPTPDVRQPDPTTTSGAFQQPQTQPQDDPWARARQGLSDVYQQNLGRQASQDEINNWLSGAYGYGGGVENYDKYVNAIMGSHEARNYRPPQTTQDGGYQNIEWWQQRGTPAIDIFDPTTGQLKPGWTRTARGYERTGGAPGGAPGGATNVTGPQGGNFQQWFSQLTQGKRISPRTLKELEPVLNQYGIRLGPLNARGFTDGIVLPDGTFVDVIQAATEDGGQGWAWMIPGPGGHGGGGGVGGGALPGNQYSDPYTQMMEELIKSRIGMLQGGINDPMRQQYMDAMQRRATALAGLEPEYQKLLERLEGRFNDLQGPGYTGAENEVLRTQALDPIERDRSAARKRVMERMAAAGHTMESGVMQMALAEVDKAFDSERASSQTTLAADDVRRREGRQQRADQIRGALYDIPQARAREQLDVMDAMQLLEQTFRQEEEARSREAIGYSGTLADLGPQRLQLAMQAAGMGGNPSSYFNNLMQLASLNQNASFLNQQNRSNWLNGLGSALFYLTQAGR